MIFSDVDRRQRRIRKSVFYNSKIIIRSSIETADIRVANECKTYSP